jgi:hypothetical protein
LAGFQPLDGALGDRGSVGQALLGQVTPDPSLRQALAELSQKSYLAIIVVHNSPYMTNYCHLST